MSSLSSIEKDGKHSAFRKGLRHWVLPNRLPRPINPALVEHSEERAKAAQNRIADREAQSAKPAGEQPARPIRRVRSSATRA